MTSALKFLWSLCLSGDVFANDLARSASTVLIPGTIASRKGHICFVCKAPGAGAYWSTPTDTGGATLTLARKLDTKCI